MRCEACPQTAVYALGTSHLCYFCARQLVFDLARTSNVKFWKTGNKSIQFRRDSEKPVETSVISMRLGAV